MDQQITTVIVNRKENKLKKVFDSIIFSFFIFPYNLKIAQLNIEMQTYGILFQYLK